MLKVRMSPLVRLHSSVSYIYIYIEYVHETSVKPIRVDA